MFAFFVVLIIDIFIRLSLYIAIIFIILEPCGKILLCYKSVHINHKSITRQGSWRSTINVFFIFLHKNLNTIKNNKQKTTEQNLKYSMFNTFILRLNHLEMLCFLVTFCMILISSIFKIRKSDNAFIVATLLNS